MRSLQHVDVSSNPLRQLVCPSLSCTLCVARREDVLRYAYIASNERGGTNAEPFSRSKLKANTERRRKDSRNNARPGIFPPSVHLQLDRPNTRRNMQPGPGQDGTQQHSAYTQLTNYVHAARQYEYCTYARGLHHMRLRSQSQARKDLWDSKSPTSVHRTTPVPT